MNKTLATLALAGASLAMFAGASPAGAAHYCVTDGQGEIRQTNGNGARGGNDEWKNSADGQERAPGTEDCGTTNPPPSSNR